MEEATIYPGQDGDCVVKLSEIKQVQMLEYVFFHSLSGILILSVWISLQ